MKYDLYYQERMDTGGCTRKVCVLSHATLTEIEAYKSKYNWTRAVWSAEPARQAVIL